MLFLSYEKSDILSLISRCKITLPKILQLFFPKNFQNNPALPNHAAKLPCLKFYSNFSEEFSNFFPEPSLRNRAWSPGAHARPSPNSTPKPTVILKNN